MRFLVAGIGEPRFLFKEIFVSQSKLFWFAAILLGVGVLVLSVILQRTPNSQRPVLLENEGEVVHLGNQESATEDSVRHANSPNADSPSVKPGPDSFGEAILRRLEERGGLVKIDKKVAEGLGIDVPEKYLRPAPATEEQIPLTKTHRIREVYERVGAVGLPYEIPMEAAAIATEEMDTLTAAQYLADSGFPRIALVYAERAVAENPTSIEAQLFRATLIPRHKRLEDKEQAYRRVLELDADSVVALAGLGNTLKNTEPMEAIPYLRKAIELGVSNSVPERANVYYDLGFSYERVGQYGEAIDAYRKCIEITPDSFAAKHIQGIEQGTPLTQPIESVPQESYGETPREEAVSDETRASDVEKTSQGEETVTEPAPESSTQEDAQTWYQRLMQEDREGLSRAHYEYAREMLEEGRLEEAADDLHRAIELNPKHTDSYRELARVYERTQDTECAAMVYQKALERFPEDERLRRDWETFRDKHLRDDAPKRPEQRK